MSNPKPNIQYPCLWGYKVIGRHEESIKKAIDDVFQNLKPSLNEAKKSSKGKFISITIEIEVLNENQRLDLHQRLSSREEISMVL